MPHRTKEQIREDFAAWVRSTREALGMSQAEASRRAKIDRQQWYRIEAAASGTKRETIIAIARAINGDVDTALRTAGYAPESDLAGKPETVEDLLSRLEKLGVEHIEFETDVRNSSPEQLQAVYDAVKLAVELTLRRK